jgi:hypothetical protein
VPVPTGSAPRISRTTRATCFCPFIGGTSFSTRSVVMMRPTRSSCFTALNAHRAATRAASSALLISRVPNSQLADRSTTSMTFISRSSTNTLTKVSFMRALTFQSIVRTSSPGW